MSKATEDSLSDLHGVVAQALIGIIKPVSRADGEEPVLPPSASHIMAAITFLKNNNITADAGSNKDLADLTEALKERRSTAKKRLSARDLELAADEFDRDLGGHLQ